MSIMGYKKHRKYLNKDIINFFEDVEYIDKVLRQQKNAIKKISYEDLDNHFTLRKKPISPYYGNIRIPRKLKKRVKEFCDIQWEGLSNGARLWYYLEVTNPNFKRFLIKKIIT